jgi:hypothetical protein
MNKQIDWPNFILYMKMKERNRITWMRENESDTRLTQLYIIYENEGKEKEIAEW